MPPTAEVLTDTETLWRELLLARLDSLERLVTSAVTPKPYSSNQPAFLDTLA